MRGTRTFKGTYTGLLCVGLSAAIATMPSHAGLAADTPSTAKIIDSLTPTGGPIVTRGFRMGTPGPETGKPATPVHTGGAAPPAAESKSAEASLTVPFASGSAILSPGAGRVLDRLGEALASPKLADFKFRIEGHTDTVGQPETNKTLSEQRAAAVLEYLATKRGIDRARLTPVGMGQEGLLVQTGPGVPNANNRRVLVVNTGH